MFLAQELCATDDSKTKANDDTDSLTSTKSIDDPHYWSNSSDVDLDDSFVSDGSLPNTDRLIDEQIASSSGFKKEISPKGESSKNEIFVMEFSRDGKYLATAGKDSMIRIWKVISSPLARLEYKSYEESHGGSKLNNKSISRNNKSATDVSNRNSCRNENLAGNDDNTNANIDINKDPCVKQLNNSFNGNNSNNSHINNHNDGININHINNGSNNHQASTSRNRRVFPYAPVFHQKPIRVFKGHTHNILSLDWSKNNFLISGSMDRTCKLWHVDRPDCLETFVHEDFVTSVKFHPTDDRFFLSGSLDNRLRLWSILEKNIAYSNDLGDNVLITAVSFTPDGLTCLAGGFNGSLFTLETNGLHILNRYEIKEKHFAKPFHNSNGDKITGIKVFPDLDATEDEDLQVRKSKLADVSIASEEKKDNRGILKSDSIGKWNVLVTTNDSKVRLVNSHKKKLVTRFKGLTNNSSSIVATVSDDHKYIISGSEDHWCYVWENNNSIINNKLKSHLAELLVEGKHHLLDLHNKQRKYSKFLLKQTHLLKKNFSMQKFLAADVDYEYISNENSSYTSFHAHHTKVNAAMFAPQETVKLLELSDDVILDLVKRHNEFSTTSTATIDPGYIIITTDAQGLIKVFRQDSAILIRKKILAARKKWIKKKPTTYTHQFVDDSTDVLSMNGTIDVDGGNESCLLHTVPNCSNCRPKNILRRNLLMHGRSLSPVHRTIKNKLQSKISKGGSSSNLPSLTSPNISQYTNDSTTTDYFTRPERSQTSTSLMNDRLGTSTPTQKTEGIFANHHVAVDFTAASTSSGMTRDVCLATENSSIPDSSLEKKLGDISFQGLRRGRKLDI